MNTSEVFKRSVFPNLRHVGVSRGLAFGVIIVFALIAFEIFNYSTTQFALHDLLGDLKFAGIAWATILAVAFCGIDFAGIARLFTPEAHRPGISHNDTWYLFGAWLLAATMNAMLTWWGVSIAIINHETLGNSVVERQTLLKVVPVFVSVMVWLIRVLIIGTFSMAGNRIITQEDRHKQVDRPPSVPKTPESVRPSTTSRPLSQATLHRNSNSSRRGISVPDPEINEQISQSHPEPTYSPLYARQASLRNRPKG